MSSRLASRDPELPLCHPRASGARPGDPGFNDTDVLFFHNFNKPTFWLFSPGFPPARE